MIKVSVDEGYAFDMLAILIVKKNKNPTTVNLSNFENLQIEIKNQIGEIYYTVLESQEFLNLIKINNDIFDSVDLVKEDKIKGSLIDKLNYQRFLIKKQIQTIFFKKDLNEQKINYE